MWSSVKELCRTEVGREFNPEVVMVDYEESAHKAATISFPNARVKGCRFHLTNSYGRNFKHPIVREAFRKSSRDTPEGRPLHIQ